MSIRHLFLSLCLILLIGSCSSDKTESDGGPRVAGGGSSGAAVGAEGREPSGGTATTGSGEIPGEIISTGSGVQSGILTAGDIDDNLNFSAYESFLNSVMQTDSNQVLPAFTIHDRMALLVTDATGTGAANARVTITPQGASSPLIEGYCNSEGRFYFFPKLDGAGEASQFVIKVRPPEAETPSREVAVDLASFEAGGTVEISLEGYHSALPLSLDLTFAIDTTGSMVDELSYITTELKAIVAGIMSEFPAVSIRFGLVVYRDEGDVYVVRSFDFTDSVDLMQQQLSDQAAEGGRDYPEAMDQALTAALKLQWSGGNTARLLFLVADAPPHDNKLSDTFATALTARSKGIHLYPLAASGVADTAEFLMRAMGVTTHGRYLFLTDDSGVGNAHAEPKIPCYVVTRLDGLLTRVISSELAGKRIEPEPAQIIREIGTYDAGVCR